MLISMKPELKTMDDFIFILRAICSKLMVFDKEGLLIFIKVISGFDGDF